MDSNKIERTRIIYSINSLDQNFKQLLNDYCTYTKHFKYFKDNYSDTRKWLSMNDIKSNLSKTLKMKHLGQLSFLQP